MPSAEDDALLRRLQRLDRASRPWPSRDPVMKLVRAEAARFTDDDLVRLGIDPGHEGCADCGARARVNRGHSGAITYSIPVAVPEMIFCGRPRGHDGEHVSCPPGGDPLARWAERHRHGRWGHRWPAR